MMKFFTILHTVLNLCSAYLNKINPFLFINHIVIRFKLSFTLRKRLIIKNQSQCNAIDKSGEKFSMTVRLFCITAVYSRH